MAARLGDVLYWAGCGLAAIVFVLSLFLAFDEIGTPAVAVGTVFASLLWLAGRACRYVLSGR